MKEYVITYVVDNQKTGLNKHYETLAEALEEYNTLSDKKIKCGWYVKKTYTTEIKNEEKQLNDKPFSYFDLWHAIERKTYENLKNATGAKIQIPIRKPRKKSNGTRKNS